MTKSHLLSQGVLGNVYNVNPHRPKRLSALSTELGMLVFHKTRQSIWMKMVLCAHRGIHLGGRWCHRLQWRSSSH